MDSISNAILCIINLINALEDIESIITNDTYNELTEALDNLLDELEVSDEN